MTDLFEQGLGYSAMNTVRSALSQVLHSPTGVPFGELSTVKQFLKGVFQEKLNSTQHNPQIAKLIEAGCITDKQINKGKISC